jgi:ABC-2 type transport system ATP-binding protein
MEVVKVENVSKIYKTDFSKKRIHALNNFSMSVCKGEIIGLIGQNGAGKSTLMKLIMGLVYPNSGIVKINGINASRPEARKKMGFLPESPNFYGELRAFEFMDLVSSVLSPYLAKKIKNEMIIEVLTLVGLSKFLDLKIKKFSKGMIQRLGFAQVIIGDPEILVLDEPLNGLDFIGRKDMKKIFDRFKSEGKTIIFSTHLIYDIEDFVDRLIIIKNGSKISEKKREDFTQEKDLEEYLINEIS